MIALIMVSVKMVFVCVPMDLMEMTARSQFDQILLLEMIVSMNVQVEECVERQSVSVHPVMMMQIAHNHDSVQTAVLDMEFVFMESVNVLLDLKGMTVPKKSPSPMSQLVHYNVQRMENV